MSTDWYHYCELILIMSIMDTKIRYQNSKIGILWTLLKPFLQFCAYFTVFGLFLKVNKAPDYALRLFFGILFWNFFTESTSNSMMAYISKKSIITKVKINRLILPISSFLTAIINFIITMIVFFFMYLIFYYNGIVQINFEYCFQFLICFVTFCIFLICMNIILSTLNVMFRDIQNIWDLVLSYAVFLTPIIYTINVPSKYKSFYYFINPLAFPIEEMRLLFFSNENNYINYCYVFPYLCAVLFWLAISILVNKRFGKKVVDYL